MVIKIEQTNANHSIFCETIIAEMENSAKVRGTGIAKRSVEYLNKKITEGNAIIAITEENEWAGFCYIETWSEEKFVVNSGLIVAPKYRIMGLARSIKKKFLSYLGRNILKQKSLD